MAMLTGTNLQYAKSYNIRIVLETIRLYGPVSRVDIARKSQLTAQTVTNITRELLRAGLIHETEKLQEGRGAPSILLNLNPKGAYSIGMDLDKDHLTAVLVDMMGTVKQRASLDLNFPSADEAMVLFEKTAHELIDAENIVLEKLWGIGVGLPGPLGISKDNTTTRVVSPKLMSGWNDVPVGQILSSRFNLPIYLENNASAAAIGERWFGAGRHIGNFFYVYFGAGLGGGIIVNGQLHSGHTGNAGELGYFPTVNLPHNGSSDYSNGNNPHLGMFFNLPQLYNKLQKNGFDIKNPDGLEQLHNKNNPILAEWIDAGANQISPLILAIEYLIDPEAIFFGGRLPDKVIKELLEKIRDRTTTLRIQEKKTSPVLQIATAGIDAAALGVAIIPLYTSMAPLPKLLMKKTGVFEKVKFPND